jgi:NAD(P)H dehydrogenase (quinone)
LFFYIFTGQIIELENLEYSLSGFLFRLSVVNAFMPYFMNILVVLAHPGKSSFNHAISEASIETLKRNGYEIIFHDLYKENFDPIVQNDEIIKNGRINNIIEEQCYELVNCDGIIVIHPNWWGQPPAIMKGWIDRVFRPGVAYEFMEGDSGEGTPIGLLKAKSVLIFNTSNTNAERENQIFHDPLESIWKNCIFDLCGVKNFYRRMFSIVVTSNSEQRKNWLDEVSEITNKYFPKLKN